MSDASDVEDALIESAQGPASASVDGQSAQAHSLRDQIDTVRFLAAKASKTARKPGFTISKIIPPGMAD